jgi:hypothetical protein
VKRMSDRLKNRVWDLTMNLQATLPNVKGKRLFAEDLGP